MPLIARRWYDIPLRAGLVATLVATVVTTSGWVGPRSPASWRCFRSCFTSLMLVLHPRIGGKPTAAVIANGAWGLMGFGLAIAVLHGAALQFGSAIGLSLALATCIGWNLALWWNGRRKRRALKYVVPCGAKRSASHGLEPASSSDRFAPQDDGYAFGSFAFSA